MRWLNAGDAETPPSKPPEILAQHPSTSDTRNPATTPWVAGELNEHLHHTALISTQSSPLTTSRCHPRNNEAVHWMRVFTIYSAFMEERFKRRLAESVGCRAEDIYLSRERSHFSGVASFLTVIVRRVPLPRNWSARFVIPGYVIDQSCIDEVDPHFVVAALICALDAKRVVADCECTMHTNLPLLLGPRRFYEPTHISPLIWHVSWSPQRCGANRNR